MKEVGFGATCGGSSSLSLDGDILNCNGGDSFSSFNQAACKKIAFNNNVTSFLNKWQKI